MDYIARFSMERNPFLKNSKEILVETSEFKEVQFRLNYLLQTKGFGLLTGSPGKGKTTAIRHWAKGLNPSLYKVIYTCLSTVTVQDFYRNLVSELNGEPRYRKPDNFRIIQNEISRLTMEKRITPVIIIDEANYISNAVLNDLKLIFNFDMDSRDRAVVLLAGLPSLNNTLNLSIHEPLRQRITMNFQVEGLSKPESKEYIHKKLEQVHCSKDIFTDNGIEGIVNAANGIPRIIDKLCNACLMIANSRNEDFINEETVLQAINDCELG